MQNMLVKIAKGFGAFAFAVASFIYPPVGFLTVLWQLWQIARIVLQPNPQ